jgi:hypothetical protein
MISRRNPGFWALFVASTVVSIVSMRAAAAAQEQTPAQDQAALQQQTPTEQQPMSLADIARQIQERKKAKDAANAASEAQAKPGGLANQAESEDQYKSRIQHLLVQRKFDELEKEADAARSRKDRFPGAVWRLLVFYQALDHPVSFSAGSEPNWDQHLENLKAWKTSNPESITAPVALALSYVVYGEEARGGGFPDTVTDQGWQLLEERTEQARAVLLEARALKARCPGWYYAMQTVALDQGWDKAKARALLDEAIAFQPDYYHYYREYAIFLLPKWYGEDGEAEQFATEVANRIGGKQGDFLYFELASVINCQCGEDEIHMARLSWPRIKKGYAALEELYGTSNLKQNRFAYIAFLAGDKAAALPVVLKIGDQWDPTVWKNVRSFETVRAWALGTQAAVSN